MVFEIGSKNSFADLLHTHLADNQIEAFAKHLGCTVDSVERWRTGETEPLPGVQMVARAWLQKIKEL